MTEQTTSAELIALAQDTLKRYGYGHLADVVDDQAAALEAADQQITEAWRVAAEQTRMERARAEAADQRAAEEERQRRLSQQAWAETLRERNQLAAVVEKVREADDNTSSWDDFGHRVNAILATAPADALREVKAEVWDEGSETGFIHGMSYQAGNNSAMDYRNPYRIEREERA